MTFRLYSQLRRSTLDEMVEDLRRTVRSMAPNSRARPDAERRLCIMVTEKMRRDKRRGAYKETA